MRFFLALASCLTLSAGDLAGLRQLEENNRIFELRAELDRRGENLGEALLYRAIATARFGAEREAVGQFRAFLAARPAPELEWKARYELSWTLTRIDDYSQAATEIALALRIKGAPEGSHADLENIHRMLEALNGVARQTVEFGPPAPVQAHRNQAGLLEVPVEVNSQPGQWIFDTGANYSTVSESEARRMGLAIREVSGYARDFVGGKHPTRLAVGDLRFGSAHLRNVVFLVLEDQSLVFSTLQSIHGILGIPVIRALECVDVSADGAIAFGKSAPAAQPPANLFLFGLNPILQVGHGAHNLQMMLDTGAVTTVLYPPILDAFASWEHDQMKGSNPPAFAGGSGQRAADLVPFIQLEAGGRTLYLSRVGLLRNAPGGKTGLAGVLGIDALKTGFRIDFAAMRFTLH